jgi:protein-disulfide isomerase
MPQRFVFLIGLALAAIVGIGVIVATTRPTSAPTATAGTSLTVTYTLGGSSRTLTLTSVSEDALSGARFVSGQADAPNTVVEFSDYECPACGLFATQVESAFETEFVDSGKVRYAFRDFPLAQHKNAPLAAQAASCAHAQGRFAPYKALLFRAQALWSSSSSSRAAQQFSDFAAQIGLDAAGFSSCLASNDAQPGIDADLSAGRRVGLQATPSFVINGYLVSGALPIEAFRAVLDRVGVKP